MNNAQSAYIIKALCQSKSITISTLLAECNIRKSLIYDMEKRNKTPSSEVLEQIADYLNCSVDYLLGRTDNTELNSEHNLSDQEEKLIDAFRSTDELGRMRIIQFVMNESDKTTVRMVADNKNSIPPIVRKKPRHT